MAEEQRGKYSWSTDKELHKTVDNKIDERVQEFNKRNKFSGNNEVKKEWDTEDKIREELKKKEIEEIRKAQEELKKKEKARQEYNNNARRMEEMDLGTIAFMAANNRIDNITSNLPEQDIDASKTSMASTTKIRMPSVNETMKKDNNEYQNNYNDFNNPNLYTPFENAKEYSNTNKKINAKNNDFQYFGGIEKFTPNLKNDYYDNFNYNNLNELDNANNSIKNSMPQVFNNENNNQIVKCDSTEELRKLKEDNNDRLKNTIHFDRMLEGLGRVPLMAADAINDTDVMEVHHKIKSKADSMVSTVAYLSANQATRSSLAEFNNEYIERMASIMEEHGIQSRFKEVTEELKFDKNGKLKKVKSETVKMGRHTCNLSTLRKEINTLGELECMKELIGNKKLADISDLKFDMIARKRNLTKEQREIIEVVKKAREVQKMNRFINAFNRSRVTMMMLVNLSAGETEVMQTANSIMSVTNMVTQSLKAFYKGNNQLFKHEIAHFTKKFAATPTGSAINTEIGLFKEKRAKVKAERQEIKRIRKQRKDVQTKYRNRRRINKIKKFAANTIVGKFTRQTSFKFLEAKRRAIGRLRHSAIGRGVSRVANSKIVSGAKKIGSAIGKAGSTIVQTTKLFTSTAAKMLSNFIGFFSNIGKIFIKYIAIFLGACFLIIIIVDILSILVDKSTYLLEFSNYVNKTIESFFPIVDDTMKVDEFGNDLTNGNTIEMLSKYEYEYIRELKSFGDQIPKDKEYTDRYGGKFTESYGDNVNVNWVDQYNNPISYTTNIKEIMSMASTQMQEDRYNSILVFNLYCSRLWRISHMYDVHGNLDDAWDYKDRTYKKDGITYYKVDDSNEKYLYKPGGETKDQMAFCESEECRNKYFCSDKEDLKNNMISYKDGHGEHQCYYYEIPIKEAKLENWINTAWTVQKGTMKIGNLVYEKDDYWISRDLKFSKDSTDCYISGTYKIEKCDHTDAESIKKKYLHITGTLTFDTEEMIYEQVEIKDEEGGTYIFEKPAGVNFSTEKYKYDYDTETSTLVLTNEKGKKVVLVSTNTFNKKLNTSLCEGHCGGHPYLEVTCKITDFSDDKFKSSLINNGKSQYDNLGNTHDKRKIYRAAMYQKLKKKNPDWSEEKLEKELNKKVEKKYPPDLIDLDNSRHIMNLVNSSLDIYYDAYDVYKDAGYTIIDSHGSNEQFLKDLDLATMKINATELYVYEKNIRDDLEEKGSYNTSKFIHKLVEKIKKDDIYEDVIAKINKKEYRKYYYNFDKMSTEEVLEDLLQAEENKIKVFNFSKQEKIYIDTATMKDTLIDNLMDDEGNYNINLDTLDLNFLLANEKEIKDKCVNDNIGHVKFALDEFIKKVKKDKIVDEKIVAKNKKDLSKKTAVQCLQYVFKSNYYIVINSTVIRESYEMDKSKRKSNVIEVEGEKIDISKLDGLYMYSKDNISPAEAFAMGEWSLDDEIRCYHYYNQDWKKDYNIDINSYLNDAIKTLMKAGSIKASGNIGDKNSILTNQIDEAMAGSVVVYAEMAADLGKKGKAIYSQENRMQEYDYYDCSSLTMFAWKKAGLNIGTNTETQLKWGEKNKVFVATSTIKGHTLMPGDILFFDGNTEHYKNVGHVGIYVGNNQMVHASSKAGHVVKVNLANYVAGDWNNLLGYMSPSKVCSNVPNSTPGCKSENKTYMPYRTITSTTSWQYELQKFAHTDKTSRIRMVGDRYCIALGTGFLKGYNPQVGTKVNVTLANGKVIKCIVGDIKSNDDTDPTNKFHLSDGSVIEFVIDDGSEEQEITKPSTDFIRNNFKGKVYKIDTLDNVFSK